MLRRLIHPVVGRVALIAVLVGPFVLPAGAVVCMDAHGRIAIEGADAATGRCAGHAADHCHATVDPCCSGHGEASETGASWLRVDPHGCTDLLIPSDLVRVDRDATIVLPPVVCAARFADRDAAAASFVSHEVTSHPPPWVRAPLRSFILQT